MPGRDMHASRAGVKGDKWSQDQEALAVDQWMFTFQTLQD
jgi:hypothetical protein